MIRENLDKYVFALEERPHPSKDGGYEAMATIAEDVDGKGYDVYNMLFYKNAECAEAKIRWKISDAYDPETDSENHICFWDYPTHIEIKGGEYKGKHLEESFEITEKDAVTKLKIFPDAILLMEVWDSFKQ